MRATRPFPATLRLELSTPGRPTRAAVALSILPRADAIHAPRRVFSGAEVRRADLVALLANGRGAMSRVRARWGEVRSQYDAILAANPDPEVPVDRQVLFTRCRAWVVNQGFSSELDASCLATFRADPDEAAWRFDVPAGTGRTVPLRVSLRLEPGRDRALLRFARLPAAEGGPNALDDAEPVRLILRPDVESRSFHDKTKAFAGPERDFPAAVRPEPSAFLFSPPGRTPLAVRLAPDGESDGLMVSSSHGRTAGPSDHTTIRPSDHTTVRPTQWAASGSPPDFRARKLVEMRDVSVVYGDRVVFEHLDWTVRAGERWLVAGPNGSGKTTLLAFVIGDHPQAYANDVRLFGVRRGTGESIWSIKKRVGWVSPELHACTDRGASVLDTVLSGLDDTPFHNGARTPARVRRAREALAAVGLSGAEDAPFGALSGGEGRLALLARAIVKRPPLLVLDEPCQNLDRPNRERFVALVDRLCADPATTLLYVTHLADTEPRCITHRLLAPPRR